MYRTIPQFLKRFFYATRDTLGYPYWTVQKAIFGLFVIGGVSQFILGLAGGSALNQEIQRLIGTFVWWLVVSVITTIIWIAGSRIASLDLYIYYRVWLKKIKPRIPGLQLDLRTIDINTSYEPQEDRPLFVRREHLMRKSFWPNWVFSIVTIFGPGKVKQRVVEYNGRNRWILDVDLRDESYGIYSSAGKRFLQRRFGEAATSDVTIKKSREFYNLMMPSVTPGRTWVWGEVGPPIPLRWASGGFLSIVFYLDRYWALLFFRDILPVGLIMANGASEEKGEYKDLHRLIGREFSEEVVLLNAKPWGELNGPTAELRQKTFEVFCADPRAPSPMAPFINPSFSEKHAELRRKHDGISISISEQDRREIFPIPTPFEVCVTYHRPDLRSETTAVRNVIYSLNPGEFGIEVIWLCAFKKDKDEYFLDGEYHLGREVLIRRPIILLDMDFLYEEVYLRQNSLGDEITRGDCPEGKMLPDVPKENCVIFDDDIKLRQRRLMALKGMENTTSPQTLQDQKTKANLSWERNLIQAWLDKYEGPFEEAQEKGLQHEVLRTLTPDAWKPIELIFAHGINYRVLG